MAKVLEVTGISGIKRRVGRMKKGAPTEIDIATKKWGEKTVIMLLQSATEAGIKPFRSNGLFQATRWEQTRNRGYLIMPMSGVYQDDAKPHWVSTKPSNVMARAWAFRYLQGGSGTYSFKRGQESKIPRSFYFTPKPFQDRAFNAALKTFPVEMGIAAKKIVRL